MYLPQPIPFNPKSNHPNACSGNPSKPCKRQSHLYTCGWCLAIIVNFIVLRTRGVRIKNFVQRRLHVAGNTHGVPIRGAFSSGVLLFILCTIILISFSVSQVDHFSKESTVSLIIQPISNIIIIGLRMCLNFTVLKLTS